MSLKICPCGSKILSDTEEWKLPRCKVHATKDGKTDKWRCGKCLYKPYSCTCLEPTWIELGATGLIARCPNCNRLNSTFNIAKGYCTLCSVDSLSPKRH